MKPFYLFLSLLIYSPLTFSQNTEKIEWTEQLSIKKTETYGLNEIIRDTPSHLLGEINGVLVYKALDYLYGIKDGKIIYNYKTKIGFYDGERIAIFQNKLLYFSIKNRNLFMTEYSLETGESIGKTIQLTTDLSERKFYVRPQKNKDFFALNFHYGTTLYDESSRCFHYLVLNSDLQVIHSNEINNELKESKKEGEHLPILMEDGRVLFFYKNKEESYYNFKIHSAQGIVTGKYSVPKGSQEKQELKNDPELFLLNDGKIKAYWAFMDSEKKFSPTKSKRTYTVASFIIDPDGNTNSSTISTPFLSYPILEKDYAIIKLAANKFEYRQRKSYLLPNEQAYIGLGESEFMDAHSSSSGAPRPNLFLFDIYVYKLDKNGGMLWSTKIMKRQPNCMNYGSYCSFISGDELWILFNDGAENYKNNQFNVTKSVNVKSYGINKSCIALVKINLETGDVSRRMVKKIEDISYWISPIDHYITDNKVQILSGRKSKTRILSLDIN